ncbi:hypothetical protein SK128_016604 [Halocaridina rubra]|uniref:Chitin-binding type-2 domain-containing protein n=1 Tax=Halocaridina rubra TaxID=373956 RepID=A0AAN8WYE8_HALRR
MKETMILPEGTRASFCNNLCAAEQPVSIEGTQTLQCSDEKKIPDAAWIKKQYCDTYAYCDQNGRYKGRKSLCRNFYECYKTIDGIWESELRNCREQSLFSFEELKCVPEPKGKHYDTLSSALTSVHNFLKSSDSLQVHTPKVLYLGQCLFSFEELKCVPKSKGKLYDSTISSFEYFT